MRRLSLAIALTLAVAACGGDDDAPADPAAAAELYVAAIWAELTPSERATMCAASNDDLRPVLAAGDHAGGASIDLDRAIAALRAYC